VRPPGVVDQHDNSLYLFTVCRPGTDDVCALALSRADAGTMVVFPEHFAQQLAPGVHTVLILDRAGRDDKRTLHVPATITLLLSDTPNGTLLSRSRCTCAMGNLKLVSAALSLIRSQAHLGSVHQSSDQLKSEAQNAR
jgi:hypothetical protein